MPAKTKAKTLGEMLREARLANYPHDTLRDAARSMGVSHAVVANWENGRNQPRKVSVRAIALYLNITLEEAYALRGADIH
ncbi:MAG: helix-turn-helix transcriptional regulator [Pseudomonadota bacterium]